MKLSNNNNKTQAFHLFSSEAPLISSHNTTKLPRGKWHQMTSWGFLHLQVMTVFVKNRYICGFFGLCFRKRRLGTSLVAPWVRIRLPMQETRVRALVQEDPTCCGATKPMRHNYWAWVPQLLKSERLEPVLHNKRSHRNEKPVHRNEE